MGRLLKRVPLDFNWPIGQIWKGYISPYNPVECKACGGMGCSPDYKVLEDKWYGRHGSYVPLNDGSGRNWNPSAWQNHLDEDDVQALLDADRLWDFTRVPINEEQRKVVEQRMKERHNSWLPYNNGYKPTPKEVNEWNKRGMGRDGSNAWIVIKAKLKRLGLPQYCEFCQGKGHFWQTKEIEKAAEAWQEFEPPKGEGYQLWENTSEGSPQSPVFKTLDELCAWCAKNATTFGHFKTSKEEWRQMLDDGLVTHKEGNMVFM